jgi:exodeoxyribonuclease VII large subunit
METSTRTVYAVSEFAEVLRTVLDASLPRVWVEGEVSNFSRPSSGHWYFTLKDERAQIRCAMFRGQNFHVRPQPRDGDRVLIRAELSFYAARGGIQLICEHLEPAGQGALLKAYEDLKRRLAADGLFDPALKRALPRLPRHIGLITSATGAAVQDVRAALARRFPLIPVSFWPVPVQGAVAAPAIVEALRGLPRRAPVDLILLVRGGGSLEDLWAFNEEIVARAIRACAVPVVCGVGHEIDTSIADYAADLRAPTPTAAAELVTPDQDVILASVEELQRRAQRALARQLQTATERHGRLSQRLLHLHPRRSLRDRMQRLDGLELQLRRRVLRVLDERERAHAARVQRLLARHPRGTLQQGRRLLDLALMRLRRAMEQALRAHHQRWDRQRALLASVSPQAVLDRGYAIARTGDRVLRDPAELAPGASFELILARGQLQGRRED